MELNHLRYFYAVAREGSFTAAARRLRVSQPSLSKTVALLEAREGVKLLERSKKGVTLTSLGAQVFTRCEQMFATLTEVENLCQGKKAICEGPLRMGASDHIANYLLAEKVAEFHVAYPQVVPSIFVGTPAEMVQLISKREMEFGLFFTKVKAPQIVYQTLFTMPLAAVCHPKLLERNQKKTLETLHYIGSIKQDYRHYPALEFLESLGKSNSVNIESNSQETQKRLCLNGAGMALLARFMVEEEIENGSLVELVPNRSMVAEMVLARRKNSELSLNGKTFLEFLRKSAASKFTK
jgi:DNA-binding transcriptional LysR family regulator